MFIVTNRPRGETSVFVLDSQTSECLHYESVPGYPSKALCRIPRDLLNEHPELEVRNDLIDCSIDICSVDVYFKPISTYLLAANK